MKNHRVRPVEQTFTTKGEIDPIKLAAFNKHAANTRPFDPSFQYDFQANLLNEDQDIDPYGVPVPGRLPYPTSGEVVEWRIKRRSELREKFGAVNPGGVSDYAFEQAKAAGPLPRTVANPPPSSFPSFGSLSSSSSSSPSSIPSARIVGGVRSFSSFSSAMNPTVRALTWSSSSSSSSLGRSFASLPSSSSSSSALAPHVMFSRGRAGGFDHNGHPVDSRGRPLDPTTGHLLSSSSSSSSSSSPRSTAALPPWDPRVPTGAAGPPSDIPGRLSPMRTKLRHGQWAPNYLDPVTKQYMEMRQSHLNGWVSSCRREDRAEEEAERRASTAMRR